MSAVFLNAMGMVCALGDEPDSMRAGLLASTGPNSLTLTERYSPGRLLPLGCLPATPLPALLHAPYTQRSRNNAVAAAAMQRIRPQIDGVIARFGPHRVAIVLGTSAAGIDEGLRAAQQYQRRGDFPPDYDYALQEMGNVALFLARELGVCGPVHVISTACSSGAKAMASAARLLRAGIADAVLAGGVDALCSFTVAGFSALESVSDRVCNPLSTNRAGINIGEGGAIFLMSRDEGPLRLAGWGETSDAYHMSAPDPAARGAITAMRQALERAGIEPRCVDYVNLHGTATPHNDAMESLAVSEALGLEVPLSSTKPLTGHTLAAAGAVEAGLAWLTMIDNPRGMLPPHWWDGERDPQLPAVRVTNPGETLGYPPRYLMSNSFAFGGSNVVLLFAGE